LPELLILNASMLPEILPERPDGRKAGVGLGWPRLQQIERRPRIIRQEQ
jgi:hypothetical protein